jgi:hypothetical protein
MPAPLTANILPSVASKIWSGRFLVGNVESLEVGKRDADARRMKACTKVRVAEPKPCNHRFG